MNKRTMVVLNAGLIAVALLVGIFLYPALPEEMATHWNIEGEADGFMPKAWGIFLFPATMLFIFALSLILPQIDPMKENVQTFRRSYESFFLWIGFFFFYVFLLTIGWNLGWRFSFEVALLPALAILWFIIGSLLERSKRNWFVGIRTPWTMESEEVWDKTHALGGKLFKAASLLTLPGLFFNDYSIYFAIIPVACAALIPAVYSYFLFRRERAGI